jgi:hypothetical protein
VIPAGTRHGEQFRLKGKGIDRLGGSGRGDHVALVAIRVPAAGELDDEQRELLRKLADLEVVRWGGPRAPRLRSARWTGPAGAWPGDGSCRPPSAPPVHEREDLPRRAWERGIYGSFQSGAAGESLVATRGGKASSRGDLRSRFAGAVSRCPGPVEEQTVLRGAAVSHRARLGRRDPRGGRAQSRHHVSRSLRRRRSGERFVLHSGAHGVRRRESRVDPFAYGSGGDPPPQAGTDVGCGSILAMAALLLGGAPRSLTSTVAGPPRRPVRSPNGRRSDLHRHGAASRAASAAPAFEVVVLNACHEIADELRSGDRPAAPAATWPAPKTEAAP